MLHDASLRRRTLLATAAALLIGCVVNSPEARCGFTNVITGPGITRAVVYYSGMPTSPLTPATFSLSTALEIQFDQTVDLTFGPYYQEKITAHYKAGAAYAWDASHAAVVCPPETLLEVSGAPPADAVSQNVEMTIDAFGRFRQSSIDLEFTVETRLVGEIRGYLAPGDVALINLYGGLEHSGPIPGAGTGTDYIRIEEPGPFAPR